MLNNKVIVVVSSLILFIMLNCSVMAAGIDPYQYVVGIGRVEDLQGAAYLTKENGDTIQLNNQQLVSSEKIKLFTLTYCDNAVTLTSGRKDIEETLTLKTGPAGSMKLIFNDLQDNQSYLIIDSDTEVNLSVRGGCTYTTDQDGEGYDSATLKWRHVNPWTRVKVIKGKVRLYYRPNGILNIGNTATANAEILVNQSQIEGSLDYEVQVVTGEAAQQVEVNGFGGLEAEMEANLKAVIDNYLNLYQVESIDELNPAVKEQLMSQLEIMKEAQREINASMEEMASANMGGNTVTILKVYRGEVKLEDTVVRSGQLSRVKGEMGLATSPEEFQD